MLQYQFESYVRRVDGAMNPHGIPIPCEISDPLWEAGLKRLIVKINGYELRRGLQGSKEKGSHIVVGRDLLTEAGVGTEDKVRVEIARIRIQRRSKSLMSSYWHLSRMIQRMTGGCL